MGLALEIPLLVYGLKNLCIALRKMKGSGAFSGFAVLESQGVKIRTFALKSF